jgi:hypothetical protein
MTSQIFKKLIPKTLLFNLLDLICLKNEKNYIFNKNSFKKGIFDNKIENFLNECKEYYHVSKQKYLDKKITYNTFTTVLRQICNSNKITYTSKIKYDKSSYDIIYYVYFNETNI